jgi:rhodanese-related sulfurtransferase
MKASFLHTALLTVLVPLSSCGQNTDIDREVKRLCKGTVPVIPADGAAIGGKVVLDARERGEYEVSHLPGAVWVGHDDFDLSRLKMVSRQDTVVVYCSIGYRSERVGERLLKAGYVNVFNMYGGIFRWKNSDGVVVTSTGDTTDRVHCYDRNWSRFLLKGEKVF